MHPDSSPLSPTDVLVVESMRPSPWCNMFGCSEFEDMAYVIVSYLASHGDTWSKRLPNRLYSLAARQKHVESLIDEPLLVSSFSKWLDPTRVTPDFIYRVCRINQYAP